MNTSELCFGQRYDPELGILEPWYTHGALDKIKSWDLSDKEVVEWGSGFSTVWWAKKTKKVYSVDHNEDWFMKVDMMLVRNGIESKSRLYCVHTKEGDQSGKRDTYVQFLTRFHEEVKPNICIVDGIHRYECAEYAIKVLKPEILIIDNHQQDYVFMCPALDELTKGIRMERFIQPDHTDHSGNPWATAIFYLNEHE